MPDLDLVTADGPLRVFTPLHNARPDGYVAWAGDLTHPGLLTR